MTGLIPVPEALQRVLESLVPCTAVEKALPLPSALGRVLATDLQAAIDVPAYDNSAMDGYALRCADLQDSGSILPQSQKIAAGHPGAALEAGTVARIFTGAPIPDGADAVVMQENCEPEGAGIRVLEAPARGQNIRLRGHDVRAGTRILDAGRILQPQDLGLLASVGIESVDVRPTLRVAILNTGDEVVPPGQVLQPGQLHDSNSFTLRGLLRKLGLEVVSVGIVPDSLEETERALRQAAATADCVISTGGVSVGEEDHVRAAVARLGQLALWKLAIKPGKPFSFGEICGKPLFGLPGNPVAVFVTFTLLVRPALLRLMGASAWQAPQFPVRLGFDVETPGSRQEYLRVRLGPQASGQDQACAEPLLEAYPDQGSSLLSSLSWADGLAVIPPQSTFRKGETVMFLPFTGLY